MKLDRTAICGLIPHANRMCLIDEVLSWDQEHIVCGVGWQSLQDSPLRDERGLAAIHGAEYAAQALALQAALSGKNPTAAGSGYLAAMKDISWNRGYLDEACAPLCIEVQVLLRSASAMIGVFAIQAADEVLMQGRLTVMNEV
jgi:predicted hotdog family 3-hydroxylacyl-ACP dehydratase